jgi:hypothetical protein
MPVLILLAIAAGLLLADDAEPAAEVKPAADPVPAPEPVTE